MMALPSASICRSPPERSPPIRLEAAELREELIDQILAPAPLAPAPVPRGIGVTRFSATVRLGNTLSRSGTSTMPRRVFSCGGRFSMRSPLNGDRALR